MKTQKTIIYKMLVGALVVIGIIAMESHSIYASNPDCTEVNITAPEQIVKGQAFDIIVTYFFDQDISAEEKREYLRSAINISSTPNTESVGNHTGRWNDDNYVFSATDIVPLDSTASNYILRAEFNGVLKDSITIPIVDPSPTPPSPTEYNVTVTTDGHGEAWAHPGSGASETEVVLREVPDDGYRFKQWEVISGGVELGNYRDYTTSFRIRSADVVIKAHFEKKEEHTRENDYGPEESKSEAAWTPEKPLQR